MYEAILLIIGGLCLLALGGEVLLRGAIRLAELCRLTPAIIGLTVVAAGTSVPELAVSMIASFNGKPDITVGNVVGSNIFNIAGILGVCALIKPLRVDGSLLRLEYPVMLLISILCVALLDDGGVNRIDAALLCITYVFFTWYMVRLVREKLSAGEGSRLEEEVKSFEQPAAARSLGITLVFIAAGVALLAFGAELTVSGAVRVAAAAGLSETVIGLTIVACGTSLPELITSIVAGFRGRDDVAVANIVGSNIFNILGILGLSALVLPLPVAEQIRVSDVYWMLGVAVLFYPLVRFGHCLGRTAGAVLLSVISVYMFQLL